ncbi:hypothetical protein [Helicobacter rodentium]|nr:hypothetical protein [Helicobacter rodentium]
MPLLTAFIHCNDGTANIASSQESVAFIAIHNVESHIKDSIALLAFNSIL